MGRTALHYVGKGLYSKEDFIREAQRYGVSRNLPPHVIAQLEWGDTVLLAFWESHDGKPHQWQFSKGRARVFGFLEVRGVSVRSLDGALDPKDLPLDYDFVHEVGEEVERKCGHYVVRYRMGISGSLSGAVRKLEQWAKERGRTLRYMLEGTFHALDEDLYLDDMPFTRNLIFLDVPGYPRPDGVDPRVVVEIIEGYRQRQSRPRYHHLRRLGLAS